MAETNKENELQVFEAFVEVRLLISKHHFYMCMNHTIVFV